MQTKIEDAAHRIARILGPSSAAAQALTELEGRRASGEDVELSLRGSMWLVGPQMGGAA